MTFRTLLVAVDQSPGSDARVRFACALATAMDAHLIGVCSVALDAAPLAEPYAGSVMVGEAFGLFRDLADKEVRDARARFTELVASRRDDSEWRGGTGLPAELVVREARAADLVILGRRTRGAPIHTADPADVLMAVGRPVLVFPPDSIRDPLGSPAVLAWKDGREAQRAASAALPLLRLASVVHVYECCAGTGAAAAGQRLADVVAWLGRHDIAAEAHVGAPDGTVSEDILAFAATRRAGLIVAGGYGHSRLREWALGGVTHDLLSEAPIPVLLSH